MLLKNGTMTKPDVQRYCNFLCNVWVIYMSKEENSFQWLKDKSGRKVVLKFDKPIFYKVKLNRDIQWITMKITDEDGQL